MACPAGCVPHTSELSRNHPADCHVAASRVAVHGVSRSPASFPSPPIDEMTTFHVGVLEHIATFMHVKDGFVKEPYPAWTAVGVTELAFGALVEIKVTQQLS